MAIVSRKNKVTTTDKRTTRTFSRVVHTISGKVVTVSDITIERNGKAPVSFRRLYPNKATKRRQLVEQSDKNFALRKVGKKSYDLTEEGLVDFSQLM